MTEDERRAIEADCRDSAIRSFTLIDAQDWEMLAMLYTEDAVFTRPNAPDQPVCGKPRHPRPIQGTAPKTKVTRHLVATRHRRARGRQSEGLIVCLTVHRNDASSRRRNFRSRRIRDCLSANFATITC